MVRDGEASEVTPVQDTCAFPACTRTLELMECDYCGKLFCPEHIELREDPYLADICDEHEEGWICDPCFEQRCMDR